MASVTCRKNQLKISGNSDEKIYQGVIPDDGVYLYRAGKIQEVQSDGSGGWTLDGQAVTLADPDIVFEIDGKSTEIHHWPSDTSGANDETMHMPLSGRSKSQIETDLALATTAELNAIIAELIYDRRATLNVDYRSRIAAIL